jgi:hypothetical protein
MVDLQMLLGRIHVRLSTKRYNFVVWEAIIRMALLNVAFAIYLMLREHLCFMQFITGRRVSARTFGPSRSNMLVTFATECDLYMERHQRKFSLEFHHLSPQTYLNTILLVAQPLYWMLDYKAV